MNIIQLTPGAGAMYCGNCLRDNALVAELRHRGHNALMLPLYLPITLDEKDERYVMTIVDEMIDSTGRGLMAITLGCGEECPYIPGAKVQDWALDDPKGQPLERVREVRDEIRRRVTAFVKQNGWTP